MTRPASYLETLEIPAELTHAVANEEAYLLSSDTKAKTFIDKYQTIQDNGVGYLFENMDNLGDLSGSTAQCTVKIKGEETQVIRSLGLYDDGVAVLDLDAATGDIVDIGFLPKTDKRSNPYLDNKEATKFKTQSIVRHFANINECFETGLSINQTTYTAVLKRTRELSQKVTEFMASDKVKTVDDPKGSQLQQILESAVSDGSVYKARLSTSNKTTEKYIEKDLKAAEDTTLKLAAKMIQGEVDIEGTDTITIAVPIPDTLPPQSAVATVKAVDLRERAKESNSGRHKYTENQAIVIEPLAIVYTATGKPVHLPLAKSALQSNTLEIFLNNGIYTNAANEAEFSANNATFENLPTPAERGARVIKRDGPKTKKSAIVEVVPGKIFYRDHLDINSLTNLYTALREGRKHQLEIEARKVA